MTSESSPYSPATLFSSRVDGLLSISWICLAYMVYLPLLGLVVFLGRSLYRFPKLLGLGFYRQGWLGVTLLLTISTLQSAYPGEAWLQMAHFLPYFLLCVALREYLVCHPHGTLCLERWAWILVLGSIPLNAVAIAQYALGNYRPTALFSNANVYGNYSVMILGLSMGLMVSFFSQKRKMQSGGWQARLWLGVAILFLLAGIYCAGSRNSYLIALVLVVIGCYQIPKKWVGKGLAWAAIATLSGLGLWLGVGGREIDLASMTTEPRVYIWRLALKLIHQSPLWGHGLGSYKILYDGSVPKHVVIRHAHNLWLSLAAEAGILVAIALTLVVGVICYRALRCFLRMPSQSLLRDIALGYGLCFLAMTLFSLFDVTLYDARLNLLSWLSLAVLSFLPISEGSSQMTR